MGSFSSTYSWAIFTEFKKRYPGGHKYDEFEKTIIEKFAPYQRVDGLVKLIKTYEDHEYQMQLKQYEWYENRADKMIKITRDLTNNRIVESFDNGRKDYLKEHTYDGNSEVGSIEANRTLEFNHYSRADHLKLVKMTNHLLYEEYQDREDKLCSREIFYGEEVSNSSAECSKRDLLCVKEIFSRNADIPATDDIAEREFDFSSNQIRMVFHYEENFITRSTRSFVKPNTAEAGGRILFFPELTEGYIANPNGKHPSHLKLYHLLCDSMKAENEVRRHVRDYEIELGSIMRSRQLELDQPQIKVHLFDTERNEFAKQGLQEKRAAVAHQMESDLESSVEHVSVYAARMFGRDWRDAITRPLSKSEAVMMRAQCLTDFKVRQLARQTVVQERYKENNSKWFAKKMWYLSNQYTLAPAAEEEYFRNNAILAFRDHVLEVQLTRYSDLSKERYKALELYLSHHPMMTALDEED